MHQGRDNQIGDLLIHTLHPAVLTGDADQLPAGFTNVGADLSDHLKSDLTCNASINRKRSRDEALINMEASIYQQLCGLNSATSARIRPSSVVSARSLDVSTMFESAASPASDQHTGFSATFSPFSPAASSELISLFYQQNYEIHALLRHQMERLRLEMEEARRRHCKTLLSILGQRAMKQLREKDAELENASRRNAELEEKARQMCAEGLIWFNLAKKNESLVSRLRTSLEQAMIQKPAAGAHMPAREGFGDSECYSPFLPDDAQSRFFEIENDRRVASRVEENSIGIPASGDRRGRMSCKICRVNEVSVLVLPCRHLCLCKSCDAGVQTCPLKGREFCRLTRFEPGKWAGYGVKEERVSRLEREGDKSGKKNMLYLWCQPLASHSYFYNKNTRLMFQTLQIAPSYTYMKCCANPLLFQLFTFVGWVSARPQDMDPGRRFDASQLASHPDGCGQPSAARLPLRRILIPVARPYLIWRWAGFPDSLACWRMRVGSSAFLANAG
ncbi:hypothetical protein KSP40_PGU019131 [Platanthera guangdongensis]|uniref:RING-type domain-containing protein n=1 Tax=Platanthera guangdongensis TaxID=2320717 RepID=A0ABR2N1B8_9ASPA